MKKILIFSALILLSAACSQNAMQGGMMTSDQCMQKTQQMHQECMKNCPMMQHMMQQHMGDTQPSAPIPYK
jgi:hypothetical protein